MSVQVLCGAGGGCVFASVGCCFFSAVRVGFVRSEAKPAGAAAADGLGTNKLASPGWPASESRCATGGGCGASLDEVITPRYGRPAGFARGAGSGVSAILGGTARERLISKSDWLLGGGLGGAFLGLISGTVTGHSCRDV